MKELEQLDNERRELVLLRSELSDLRYWLNDGYKLNDALAWTVKTIDEKIKDLSVETDRMLTVIFEKKEQLK